MPPDDELNFVGRYEWGEVRADAPDPNAGGASHHYEIRCCAVPDGPLVTTTIQFQHGPRAVEGSTLGILDEHLLMIIADRMRAFEAGPFAHPANARVLAYVSAASAALRERAEERRARGVLGKNEK